MELQKGSKMVNQTSNHDDDCVLLDWEFNKAKSQEEQNDQHQTQEEREVEPIKT